MLRDLRGERLPACVVILTASLGTHDILEAIRLGARGVMLKDMAPNLLVRCIRTVHAGGRWLEQGLAAEALNRLMEREASARQAADLLTPRELEIVRMVMRGLRNKEIARELGIAEGTAKIHLHNIYQKVDVDSRVSLMLYAQEKALV